VSWTAVAQTASTTRAVQRQEFQPRLQYACMHHRLALCEVKMLFRAFWSSFLGLFLYLRTWGVAVDDQDVVPIEAGPTCPEFGTEPCKRRRGKSAPCKSLQPIRTFAPLLRRRVLSVAEKVQRPERSQAPSAFRHKLSVHPSQTHPPLRCDNSNLIGAA